jgi:hypothetical protein
MPQSTCVRSRENPAVDGNASKNMCPVPRQPCGGRECLKEHVPGPVKTLRWAGMTALCWVAPVSRYKQTPRRSTPQFNLNPCTMHRPGRQQLTTSSNNCFLCLCRLKNATTFFFVVLDIEDSQEYLSETFRQCSIHDDI